jgi:CubicO group peptidase (beta-lactamase class C family)
MTMSVLNREFAVKSELDAANIQRFIHALEQEKLEINRLVLLHNGACAADYGREPYRKESKQVLFSLSKSFTSIAVGIAWDHGYLRLDDPVIHFFPDKLPEVVSPNLAAMTIHHLLAMNTGQEDDCYPAVVARRDWVKAFLALPVARKPGTFYRYNTPASHVLAAIVERATGQALVDFLQPYLFDPLGIAYPEWERNASGVTAGGMGLSLPMEAVARFGQMLLQQGVYEGQRIVSAAYIALATAEHSDNRMGEERTDYAQGYGYQFFLCRRGCYMGTGAFGQLCFVAPQYGIVVAASAALKGSGRLQQVLALIYQYLLDPLDARQPDKRWEEHWSEVALVEAADSLSQPLVFHRPSLHNLSSAGGTAKPVSPELKPQSHPLSGWYSLSANPERLRLFGLLMTGSRIRLHTAGEDGEKRELAFDASKPVAQRTRFIKDIGQHEQEAVTYAIWNNPTSLTLTIYYIETPYIQTYTVTFLPGGVQLDAQINVSFALQDYTAQGKPVVPDVAFPTINCL